MENQEPNQEHEWMTKVEGIADSFEEMVKKYYVTKTDEAQGITPPGASREEGQNNVRFTVGCMMERFIHAVVVAYCEEYGGSGVNAPMKRGFLDAAANSFKAVEEALEKMKEDHELAIRNK